MTTTAARVVEGLPGFETVEVILEGESLLVALADTRDLRTQGLMGVTDLGGLDGMVFVFPDPSVHTFWMKDTLIPLDLAFFATDGSLLGVLTLEPCPSGACPSYGVGEPSQWAIEVPAGGFADLPLDATLDVGRDPFLALFSES
ncbi:MAG: DUF192 domain-containing protein [Acidimicrobiia bacterium]|nr:DUF192 domain-containing protein [Acidimicrobiia bacterium]MDH3397012.1 DUF192 domain-containing protein [Acidimicrobiia bacterium]MDH5616729.1 DUF192 domain-containing protein [Acidimicrobiia bacterium]